MFNKKKPSNECKDFSHCPLIGGLCIQKKCAFYTKVQGKDPQSEKIYDEWKCAIVWLPIMLIENSQMTRQGTATVQNFRNEVHQAAQAIGEESVRRRELEERRIEMDERILEHANKKLLKSGKKE